MPKDEILDGSTWTDVQPQKEEILDGSTWTEVKKKDVPAPKLESGSEATISSNGQSKSTSASTIVSKPNPNNQTSFTVSKENSFGIPNFQIPGVQKNTFNPLTEQQKAAGKKVLGEGTTVVEQQKVKTETPETSAKKSAILKAVTGKDISYDEVSRLSDVSNTDYAGILAAQKEKQKTDNTFATNPALQEEQRQEQVKQSEFLGNREFKVNNPQANVQILEQKNPTLLKDIADKTLELDEQRTAESFNKDKPVSQRFSKPESDVPYKPFTDYLEVDELATVSPMELYETREKESDRDKQLKYFRDRGKDNVFNEYDNEQTAISYKQSELKKKYDTAVNNLKSKYGENWLNSAEQGDKNLADLISAQTGLQENYNLSKDLVKSDKYAEVNKTIQERAQRQAEIDKTAKDDTWYKFTDESNKIQNVVMNTAYGLVNDIASLPRFFNGLSGNNDFNWTDKVADATQRFTDAGMAYFNTPTDVQRDNVQDYAEVDGYRVFLDKKGNPTSLRDADNFMVNNDAKKEEIFTKYSDNKDKIKVKTDWIDGEQIMNQSSKIIGDMLVMIAEGGGIGAGIKGVGKVSRSARILNLAENAKLTTSLAVISQMQNEMMNDAIDKGMSKEDAAKYAAISSAGVAAISLINPMEAQFLKNIKNVKSLASEEVTSFLNGNTTLADLSKKTIGAVIGNSVPEIAEEQFFEPVLQNVVNDSYKNQVGVNEQLDQTDVLGRENLAQSVLTATTTFLPSALESSKNMNSNSIKMNILENPENWMAIIDKKKELGIIEDDIYSAEVAAMQKAKKKYDTLKSEVKQGDRTKLAGLIGDKVAIESKLSDAPELKPKYENQVKEIDSKISNLTNGISETPETELASAVNIQSQDFGAEAKQDAKIESAVIEIGGKIYEGKNHAEAILKAKADGQDISQVNRQAEGKFKLSDGTIIDRAESKSRFGQDRSELMIPQDDNAKQANKDYAKITKNNEQQTTTNVEQKSVNNDSSGLSETSKNVESNTTNVESKGLSNESEVPIAEQKVSEEVTATKEETPTALRDVESTAKALENKLPDAYQANTRNQSTKDLIKWAEDIFDTKFEGDFEKGEYVSWFQSLGNEGYEAAGLLNTPKRALLKLKESPTYKGKAVESLLSKEQTPASDVESMAKALEEIKNKKLNSKEGEINTGNIEVVKDIPTVNKVIGKDKKGNEIKVAINGNKLKGTLLSKGGNYLFKAMQGRIFTLAKVGDFYLPFYISSAGTSGKIAGEWYPFFGYNNWLVKGRVGTKGEMEYSQKISDVQKLLNENFILPAKYLAADNKVAIGEQFVPAKDKNGNIIREGKYNFEKMIPNENRKVLYDLSEDIDIVTHHHQEQKGETKLNEHDWVAEKTGLNPKNVVNDGGNSADNWINDIIALTENVELASKGVIKSTKAVESLLSKEQTPTDVKQKKAESEQGKLSNEDKIQQNATTEVQKQITEVEKIISELEDNPNSPFHKLVNLDEQKQKLSELQKKEAEVKKESAQPVLPETKAQKAVNPRLSALPKKKAVPTEKVEEKVDNVEIKKLQEEIDSFDDEYNRLVDAVNKEDRKLNTPKSENEIKLNQLQDKINALIDKRNKLQETPQAETQEVVAEIKSKNLTHVKGKNMGENQALGTYISTEKGNRYETPTQKAEKVEVDIENPYVVDNGDFGLVDKRQEVLNNNRDKFTAEDSNDYQELPKGKLTVDDLNDAGIKKLAELTTNELKAQGYDAIYFKESDTQEGELVVFDKEKVKFEENIINLVEDKAENELANNKLTEKDNIEQEPSIKDIEGKAESNNEVELNEVVKKSCHCPVRRTCTDNHAVILRAKINRSLCFGINLRVNNHIIDEHLKRSACASYLYLSRHVNKRRWCGICHDVLINV